jgi:hypothetical protein
MTTCWRCGKEIPEDIIECPEHCSTQVTFSHGPPTRRIDWSKVHSIDDLKTIMSIFGFHVLIGSPAEDALRDFLAD